MRSAYEHSQISGSDLWLKKKSNLFNSEYFKSRHIISIKNLSEKPDLPDQIMKKVLKPDLNQRRKKIENSNIKQSLIISNESVTLSEKNRRDLVNQKIDLEKRLQKLRQNQNFSNRDSNNNSNNNFSEAGPYSKISNTNNNLNERENILIDKIKNLNIEKKELISNIDLLEGKLELMQKKVNLLLINDSNNNFREDLVEIKKRILEKDEEIRILKELNKEGNINALKVKILQERVLLLESQVEQFEIENKNLKEGKFFESNKNVNYFDNNKINQKITQNINQNNTRNLRKNYSQKYFSSKEEFENSPYSTQRTSYTEKRYHSPKIVSRSPPVYKYSYIDRSPRQSIFTVEKNPEFENRPIVKKQIIYQNNPEIQNRNNFEIQNRNNFAIQNRNNFAIKNRNNFAIQNRPVINKKIIYRSPSPVLKKNLFVNKNNFVNKKIIYRSPSPVFRKSVSEKFFHGKNDPEKDQQNLKTFSFDNGERNFRKNERISDGYSSIKTETRKNQNFYKNEIPRNIEPKKISRNFIKTENSKKNIEIQIPVMEKNIQIPEKRYLENDNEILDEIKTLKQNNNLKRLEFIKKEKEGNLIGFNLLNERGEVKIRASSRSLSKTRSKKINGRQKSFEKFKKNDIYFQKYKADLKKIHSDHIINNESNVNYQMSELTEGSSNFMNSEFRDVSTPSWKNKKK